MCEFKHRWKHWSHNLNNQPDANFLLFPSRWRYRVYSIEPPEQQYCWRTSRLHGSARWVQGMVVRYGSPTRWHWARSVICDEFRKVGSRSKHVAMWRKVPCESTAPPVWECCLRPCLPSANFRWLHYWQDRRSINSGIHSRLSSGLVEQLRGGKPSKDGGLHSWILLNEWNHLPTNT